MRLIQRMTKCDVIHSLGDPRAAHLHDQVGAPTAPRSRRAACHIVREGAVRGLDARRLRFGRAGLPVGRLPLSYLASNSSRWLSGYTPGSICPFEALIRSRHDSFPGVSFSVSRQLPTNLCGMWTGI